MGKIKQSPKIPAAERCEQLLVAAAELFTKKGYRDTTTEAIARRAGVTKGAVYYHFKSKEDILFALVKQLSEKHLGYLGHSLQGVSSPVEAARQLGQAIEAKKRNDLRDSFDFWIQAMRVPRIKRYINQQFRLIVDRFAATVDSSYGSKAERRHLIVFSLALYHGLKIRQVLDPDIVNMAAQTKLYESLLEGRYGKAKATKGKK